MRVTSKSGREFDLPDAAETARIRRGMADDPDAGAVPDVLLRRLRPLGRPKTGETKERISIRLSPEVVRRFRSTGPGWQTRMDAALKDWLKDHMPGGAA